MISYQFTSALDVVTSHQSRCGTCQPFHNIGHLSLALTCFRSALTHPYLYLKPS
ncbi:hypothetical protein M378DRAFT_1062858 [Amanita muscaria Koide BX008]|uniref:Uncharacterized protein n=1 Tax=Amanita muscaria (strain Koide BX008) TaxID=946122 RepID=A0A0C2WG43_AMAMK|nr:hypothetical protein M378DRAFT_1062858 [Amanita muscaria Koide BX008]